MKILIWLRNFILHFIMRILQIITTPLVSLICVIIYVVTYEPNTHGRATVRKCRRIRRLTKFKLYAYKYFKPICAIMHDTYLTKLYNKFHFLIDK
jgi:hypothetical protein